jgi:hypothetical protein
VNRARSYGRKVEVVDDTANLAFPKVAPKGEEIDYSALAIPKAGFSRDNDFRAFVRGHVCAAYRETECQGVTEHAHLATGGKSIKADDRLSVPLCSYHHRQCHDLGLYTFQINHGINLWESCARLLAEWIKRIETRA